MQVPQAHELVPAPQVDDRCEVIPGLASGDDDHVANFKDHVLPVHEPDRPDVKRLSSLVGLYVQDDGGRAVAGGAARWQRDLTVLRSTSRRLTNGGPDTRAV